MTRKELHEQFGPKLVCNLPGPKAQAAVEADARLISPSYTRSYPLVAKSGRGIRITDVDGNEFLDFAAGIAARLVPCANEQDAGELAVGAGGGLEGDGVHAGDFDEAAL